MDQLNEIARSLVQESEAVVEALRSSRARLVLDRVGEIPDERYLDIAAIAAQICDTPVAAVSLIDDDQAFYKGLFYNQVIACADRSSVICNVVTKSPDQPTIIYDATADIRVCGLPFVNGTYDYIKFYAGYPLTTKDGYAIGSLCVVDRIPRKLRPDQEAGLERLRRVVMRMLGED